MLIRTRSGPTARRNWRAKAIEVHLPFAIAVLSVAVWLAHEALTI